MKSGSILLGYSIRIYPPSQVGTQNTSSELFQVSGEPHTIYRISNPDPGVLQHATEEVDNGDGTTTLVPITILQPPQVRGINIVKLAGAEIEAAAHWNGAMGAYPGTHVNYTYSELADDWTMNDNSLRLVCREKIMNSNQTSYREIVTTKLVKKKVGNSENAPETTYTYYLDDSNAGNYGKLATEQSSSGMWHRWHYDNFERVTMEVSPFGNQTINTSTENARATYYLYSSVDPQDVPQIGDPRPRVKETRVNGIAVSKEYFAGYTAANGDYVEITEECRLATAEYGNPSNSRLEKRYYPATADAASAGRLKSVRYPDGRLESFSYEYGNYLPGVSPGDATFTPFVQWIRPPQNRNCGHG